MNEELESNFKFAANIAVKQLHELYAKLELKEQKMKYQLTDVEQLSKGALEGKFSLYDPENKFKVRDCKVFSKNGARWINMPQREYTNMDGQVKYFDYFYFDSEEDKTAFRDKLLAMYEAQVGCASGAPF